jgi:hypothetical protein
MSVKVDIDPRVLLVEMRARIEFYENRCILLGQENLQLRQTIDVQAKEIERLKAPLVSAKKKA